MIAHRRQPPLARWITFAVAIALSTAVSQTIANQAHAETPFSLAKAIENASAGDTIKVPPGVYAGPFSIDKPITLIGVGRPILDGGGDGDVVDVVAPDVTIRGFIIRNTGDSLDRENTGVAVTAHNCTVEDNIFKDVLFGVYMKKASGGIVRNNVIGAKNLAPARRGDGIRLWECKNATVEGNRVVGGRDVVLWFCDNLVVRSNLIRHGRYGLHFMYSDDNLIENNRLERNSVGAFLMYSHRLTLKNNIFAFNRGPSGYGVGLKDMDSARVSGNRFVGNRIGVYLDNSPSTVDERGVFTSNVFAYNDMGVGMLPSVRQNDFFKNAFIDNIQQVAVLGGGDATKNRFTVDGVGNYWSDYRGFDVDDDGVGDMPYDEAKFFDDLVDRQPKLRMFLFSPAHIAIESAVRAFPIVKPRVKLTDTAPLATPPMILASTAPSAGAEHDSWLVLLGASLLLLTGLIGVGGTAPMGSVRRSRRSAAGRTASRASMNHTTAKAPLPTSAVALRVKNLHKQFGKNVALREVSFDVPAGHAVALWGANGAGKTTIIRCALGLLRHRGEVCIAGENTKRSGRRARSHVGYMPQELTLYQDLRAVDLLRFIARLRRAPGTDVDAALTRLDLQAHAKKRIAALSGGMKARLALAAALLGDPDILILDEPTANLDDASRQALLRTLLSLKETDKTILFSSHRLDDVLSLADEVVELRDGVVDRIEPPARLAQRMDETRERLLFFRLEHASSQEAATQAARAAGGRIVSSHEHSLVVGALTNQRSDVIAALVRQGVSIADVDVVSTHEGACRNASASVDGTGGAP